MSTFQVIASGIALVGLIGVVDHLTGYELSLSIFYLAPITLVAWYANRGAGVFVSLVSASVWLAVDFTAGQSYRYWWFYIWNAAVRLGFFLLTTYMLVEIKTRLRYEEQLARIDSLTRVLNARAFKEVCERLIQLAGRHHHSFALAYIDIDNFKAVNDGEGHSSGDRLLCTVGNTLIHSIRSSDVTGRLGGDEFAVLMPETGFDGAKTAFTKIHRELVRVTSDVSSSIGFSIGVAIFLEAPANINEALKIADHLMYQVKESGKNNLVFAELTETGRNTETFKQSSLQ